ncbi:hypothetical protein [Methylocella sp.]|uniref:hypothetical protein n=1 Tax=Methylocella sp. TaxID=1978226 RepID=UPI003784B44C
MTILLSVMLSGCISSKTPLITEVDAVTPLPDAFVLAEIDTSGKFVVRKSKVETFNVSRNNKTYLLKDTGSVRFYPYRKNMNTFIAQLDYGFITEYGIVNIIQKELIVSITANMAELKSANIKFEEGAVGPLFSDKAQLIAAGDILVAHFEAIRRFKIITNDNDRLELQRFIAAQEQAGTGSQPAPASSFTTSGYTDPELMREIYEHDFQGAPAPVYAQELMSAFFNEDGCRQLINRTSFAKISAIAAQRVAHDIVLGDRSLTTRSPRPGAWGEFFAQGWNQGAGAMNQATQFTKRADDDAVLLYTRYGCQSPVLKKFFDNLSAWIDAL